MVMARSGDRFAEEFDAPCLDETVWLPHYLPAWSSRAASAASLRLDDSHLTIDVPVEHRGWCEGEHQPPIRVSGIQSGNFSGPIGSTVGQQPFREGQTVLEEQPRFEGWLPTHGHVEMRARMTLSHRSMASLWLVGFEDEPERCGEICVVEVFGRSVQHPPGEPSAEVGMGLHAFRDPDLGEDFQAPRLDIDVSDFHTFAVDWDARAAAFSVDGRHVRRCARPPTYPMQLMVAVFDFPQWSRGTDDHLVPEMVVDWIRGSQPG
jgi:hypothetical protein